MFQIGVPNGGWTAVGKRLLVACDTHTTAEIGAAYRWLVRMGKEFEDEYKDD
jgi:hypothetical protein